MSTLRLTFEVQALDFAPLDRGQVEVTFTKGPLTTTLILRPRIGVATFGYFQEVEWDGSPGQNEFQAAFFRQAWNRDYITVGGTIQSNGLISKNLVATLQGNEVTITAEEGTFDSWNYTGNVLIVGGTIDNSVQVTPDNISAARQNVGDCSTVRYSVTASGDNAPFDLYRGSTLVQAGWDGTALNVDLPRGIPSTLEIRNGTTVRDSVSVIVPRTLSGSEFSISLTQYLTSADVSVTGPTVAGTGPLEYAITPVGDSTGSNYQASNSFQGVLEGQYRLWIRDVYGCETSRIIDVTVVGSETELEAQRWFLIPEGQSIPFAENVQFDKDNKPNFFNTGSYNENVLTVYRTGQEFDFEDDNVGVQFQSSYPEHLIQLVGNDNSVQVLTPVLIQQNLGVVEKADCVLYPLPGQESSKTGVYFNGGNLYEPNTTTPIAGSPYNGSTPAWSKVGQIVSIDGLGTFTIEGTGFDTVRGGYFVISLVTASESAGLVQATYNKHPYNLYEFYFSPSQLTAFSYIVIDKGFDGVEWDGNPFVSEPLIGINDSINHLLIRWSDSKNRGDIVFNSGINYWFRRVGEFYGEFSNNESEIYAGDSQTYSIQQKTYLDFTVTLEMLSARQVNMLNIASALEGFSVNGLRLVRKDAPEIRRLDKSNLHTWKCTFAFGANQVAVQGDEIVLNVNNGTISGQGPDLSAITLYRNNAGRLVLNNSANLVRQ